MHYKCEGRVLLLSLFLVCQLLVVALYIWGGPPRTPPARFLHNQVVHEAERLQWDADSDSVLLPLHPVDQHFVLINDTSCFRQGTNLR